MRYSLALVQKKCWWHKYLPLSIFLKLFNSYWIALHFGIVVCLNLFGGLNGKTSVLEFGCFVFGILTG